MLEEKIEELTKAVNRLTNTLLSQGGKSEDAAEAKPAKPAKADKKAKDEKPAKAKASKHTADSVRQAIIKFAQANSKPEAIALMKKVAGTDEIAGIPEEKYQAIMDAIENGAPEGKEEDDDFADI